MSVIYLIRHGQASFGQENYDKLSDLGVRQAELLGEYFCKIKRQLDAVYSGSLQRQSDTAKTVLSRLPATLARNPLQVVPEFNEFDTYSAYMSQIAELLATDPSLAVAVSTAFTDRKTFREVNEKLVARWRSGEGSTLSGDIWKGFRERVRTGLERVRADNGPGKQVAVFTSGGTIAAAVQIALELSDERTFELPRLIRNSSVTTFLYSDTRFSLSSYNEIAHLELPNEPGLVTLL